MPKKKELTELALTIADHQANLTRLSERWGQIIVDQMDETDRAMIAKLKSLLDDVKANYKVNTQKSVDQLEYIRRKVQEIRAKAFVKAEKQLREEVPDLIDNETKWSKALLSELTGEKASAFAALTDGQAQKILKSSMLINKPWDDWWTHTTYGDVMRIANVVNAGVVQGWTIDQMIQRIMGTKANNYTDGILSTNRAHARNLARTLCGGISNQAKDQFYRDNDDVVIGVEWLDTLDGRTCLARGQMVETPEGEKTIESLCVGQYVIGGSGKHRKILSTSKKTVQKTLIITLSNGEKIRCTEDHPFLTEKGWIDAGKLKEGDFLEEKKI